MWLVPWDLCYMHMRTTDNKKTKKKDMVICPSQFRLKTQLFKRA